MKAVIYGLIEYKDAYKFLFLSENGMQAYALIRKNLISRFAFPPVIYNPITKQVDIRDAIGTFYFVNIDEDGSVLFAKPLNPQPHIIFNRCIVIKNNSDVPYSITRFKSRYAEREI